MGTSRLTRLVSVPLFSVAVNFVNCQLHYFFPVFFWRLFFLLAAIDPRFFPANGARCRADNAERPPPKRLPLPDRRLFRFLERAKALEDTRRGEDGAPPLVLAFVEAEDDDDEDDELLLELELLLCSESLLLAPLVPLSPGNNNFKAS